MIWLIPGFILCVISMSYGAALAFKGEIVRPIAWVTLGLSFVWTMWEVSHF